MSKSDKKLCHLSKKRSPYTKILDLGQMEINQILQIKNLAVNSH